MADERTVVDAEHHGQGRRIDGLCLNWRVDGRVAQGVGDGRFRDAGNCDDVASKGFVDGCALEATEGENLGDALGFNQSAVAAECFDGLAGLDRARTDAAGENAAEVGIGFKRCRQHEEWPLFGDGRRHVFENEFEQRGQVAFGALGIFCHPAVAARAIQRREIQLLRGRVEAVEQIEDLVQDLIVAFVGTIDLVDDDNRAEAKFQGF